MRPTAAAPPVVLIAGPTASGKSALAAALAERLEAEVANADSMQVYRELAVLTARPGPAEEARAPHRLYGHVPLTRPRSVADWLAEIAAVLAETRAAGRPLVVVGGTGLYFKALSEGLSPVPAIPEAVRAEWRARGREMPAAALHAELAARDREMAGRLRPSDTQRIVRALEVVEGTGRSLAAWQALPRETPLAGPSGACPPLVRLVLSPERACLWERIAQRFEAMLAAGALAEAEAVEAMAPDPALPATKALGLRPLREHVAGRLSLAEATARAIAESRRYAKRQRTFFRHQLPDWPRAAAGGADVVATLAARVAEADRAMVPAARS